MLKQSKAFPFWLLTFSVTIILIVSQLLQDGMFMDGMIYVAVSKNLAEGLGTFWDPHFSVTYLPSYHEQPPLYFGLLAVFYKIFGTGMYVERLFCFCCYAVTAFFIHKIWKKVFLTKPATRNISWLPILFWTITPICFWAYTNHVEETVMTVFVVTSVYFIYCALFLNERVFTYLLIAGVLIFLSSFTKGVQGLFPLAAVGFYWIVFRKISFSKMIYYSLILVGVPVIIYSFLLIYDSQVYVSFAKYFEARYIPSFNNSMATTSSRFELIQRLAMELFPIALLTGLILFFTTKFKDQQLKETSYYKTILWFLLIGLSGSLPLLVTLEQRGFYLTTPLPFFVIGIAMLAAPGVTILIGKINPTSYRFNLFRIAMIILFASTIFYSVVKTGDKKRDADLLSDVYKIGGIVNKGEIVSIPDDMSGDWSLRAYLVRYFNISMSYDSRHKYFIIRKDLPQSLVPRDYRYTKLETKKIDLYEIP